MSLYKLLCEGFDSLEIDGHFLRYVDFDEQEDAEAICLDLHYYDDEGNEFSMQFSRANLDSAKHQESNGSWDVDGYEVRPYSVCEITP